MDKNTTCCRSYIKEWLSTYKSLKYSAKTIESYRQGIQALTRFLAQKDIRRVQEVTTKHLESFRLHLVEKNLSEATLYLYLRSVRYFFRYLEESQYIFINPAATLSLPKACRKLGSVPSEKEVKQLLAAPNPATPAGLRDRAMLETLYTCGLRRAELQSLTIFDLDVKQGTLRIIGKGNRERMVPLGKHARFYLKKYMETVRPKLSKRPDENGLWLGRSGGRLSAIRIAEVIKIYWQQAGCKTPITAHSLRRACATHMLRGGAHPVQIQMLLGHVSLATLSQYLQVTITDMKKMHRKSRVGQ